LTFVLKFVIIYNMADNFLHKTRCLILPCEENKYKPKILSSRFLYGYAISILILKIVVIPLFLYLPTTSFFADITKTSIIQLANNARVSLGFNSLKENQTLNEAALLKAQDMLANDYFAHTSPEGVNPWYWFNKAGYNYRYAGENLAIGFIESEDVNQAWLDSPLHRENILRPEYTDIGIAVLTGDFQGKETTVVVQLFGTQKAVLAANQAEEQTPVVVQEATNSIPETTKNETATETETTTTEIASNQNSSGQVLSAYDEVPQKERSFLYNLISFMASNYYDILQKIIYGSLALIGLLFINTVIFDIFIYHSYEIQHKDILVKTLGFCALLALLLAIDKTTIAQVFPRDFFII
jgi:hypothetical protein